MDRLARPRPTHPAGAAAARRPLTLLLVAFALAALIAAPRAEARHQKGEKVRITGLVNDAQGVPLTGVRVVLEASREVFSFRELHSVLRDTTRVSTVTDAEGEFSLEWPWDSFYNHFELTVGVPVRHGREETLEVLERSDLTRRIARSNPVVANLQVANAEFVRTLRTFLAGLDTADEQRVYQEMGKPDRIEQRGSEAKWYYFERGAMFRFEDGRLVKTERFAPVAAP